MGGAVDRLENALKGVGFFMGAALLAGLGFVHALWAMAAGLMIILAASVALLPSSMGKAKAKVKFTKFSSKTRAINLLSAARFFLVGARDVWFVVGVPIFLHEIIGWGFMQVGTFMACWVVGYGGVQAFRTKASFAVRLMAGPAKRAPRNGGPSFWPPFPSPLRLWSKSTSRRPRSSSSVSRYSASSLRSIRRFIPI